MEIRLKYNWFYIDNDSLNTTNHNLKVVYINFNINNSLFELCESNDIMTHKPVCCGKSIEEVISIYKNILISNAFCGAIRHFTINKLEKLFIPSIRFLFKNYHHDINIMYSVFTELKKINVKTNILKEILDQYNYYKLNIEHPYLKEIIMRCACD